MYYSYVQIKKSFRLVGSYEEESWALYYKKSLQQLPKVTILCKQSV